MHHPYIDEYSGLGSFIHRLEPRAKIIGFFSFVVFVALLRAGSYAAFALSAFLAAMLIGLSGIPLRFILKRSLVIVPFVLMIAAFIPFMKDGRIIARLGLGSFELAVSQEGLVLFSSIVIKACLSVCAMVLLMNSMRFSDFLKGLERLKIPPPIIMLLSFIYRYIFVFEDEFMKMRQAKDSRTARKSGWLDFKAYCLMTGVLFLHSYDRAEGVYLAMCSRGYRGSIGTIGNSLISAKDVVFLAGLFLALAGIGMAA